ncbi:hypothetical protein Pve01_31390 [Planomonospora venezuelensis]|nr:hypothetical protein Pve01_31390 [Planomonospora venezuelensis]
MRRTAPAASGTVERPLAEGLARSRAAIAPGQGRPPRMTDQDGPRSRHPPEAPKPRDPYTFPGTGLREQATRKSLSLLTPLRVTP